MGELELVSQTFDNQDTLLRISCFGTFKVIRPNEEESICLGSRHKLWSLFKYLVANKGVAIPTQNIMDLFWSERKELSDTAPLRTAICRLKTMLEPKRELGKRNLSYIIYHQDSCTFNNNSDYWLDIEEFENLCLKAKHFGKYDRIVALESYQKAFEIYRGDFLAEDLYQEWTNSFREYYRNLFLNSVREAAKWFNELKEYQQARLILQRALENDSYIEELHILLMQALLGMGEAKGAIEHYTICSSMFYQEFGIGPSKELKLLYREAKERSEKITSKELILKGNLESLDDKKEPFVCEPELFWSIILLERRRMIRHEGETSLVMFELITSIEDNPKDEMGNNPMESLELIARKNLRKSDAICRLDGTHLALLLPLTGISGGNQVVNVIKDDFYDKFEENEIELQIKNKILRK